MNDVLVKILDAATYAPSGENAQPWHFIVSESQSPFTISVFVNSDRDSSPYGWGSRASYVAIGAALENIKIAASEFNMRTELRLFPSSDQLHVADITLCTADIHVDPLLGAIRKRITNRKPYHTKPIPPDILAKLQACRTDESVHIRLTTDTEKRRVLAHAGTTNELIMLNNKSLHEYFFSHINWSTSEDTQKKIGFYIKTLELPPPAVFGFKLMRSWARARFLNTVFRMNAFVQKTNAAIYEKSPALGVIYADTESPESAVRCGMTLQRFWLEVTASGLVLQPIAGLLYIHLRIAHDTDTQDFSPEERAVIETAYTDIDRTFQLGSAPAYFMFRIGYADPASAQAVRFPVAEVSATT